VQQIQHTLNFFRLRAAKGYVAWLQRITGKNYRLLSEAEWEYSARAGNQGRRSEAQLDDYAFASLPRAPLLLVIHPRLHLALAVSSPSGGRTRPQKSKAIRARGSLGVRSRRRASTRRLQHAGVLTARLHRVGIF